MSPMARIFDIFLLLFLAFLFNAKCQTDSEGYNLQRNGFGSVTPIYQDPVYLENQNQQQNSQPLQQGFQQQQTQNNGQFGQQNPQQQNFQQPGQQGAQQQQIYYSPNQLYFQSQNYQPVQSGYQQNSQFQPNQQGIQQGDCSLNGCQPPTVNQQEYLASADQYSYPNENFGYQPQQFSGSAPEQNSAQTSGQVTGSPQFQPNFQGNNQQNIGQPQYDQSYNGGVGGPLGGVGGPVDGSLGGSTVGTPPSPIQKLSFVNIVNDTNGRPIVEQISMTKVGNSVSNITVSKTEMSNPDRQNLQSNGDSNLGYLIPNYYGQQNPGIQQNQATSGGIIVGDPNSGNNFQQNPGNNLQYNPNTIQRLPGQPLIGGNGVTTGDVVMAPNGQGVPLLVSADWVQNNRLTGQIKIIDASYANGQFLDYLTFQRQNMYGNFAQLSAQYTNQDYLNSHITNAIYFNLDIATYPTRNQKYTLYPPNVFQNYVQSLGINIDDYLIVYSRDSLGGMRYAAAIWELFRIYNHTKISVLNGGFNAWTIRGYPMESGENQQQNSQGNWKAGFDSLKVITFEEMTAIQPNGKCYFNEPDLFNFLDTRPRVEFLQNGRLYCSKNFQVNQLINTNGTLVSAIQINVVLARANYTRGQTSFVLDDDGPEAAFGVLALAVVGDSTARLYNGGLNEIRQRSPAILVR